MKSKLLEWPIREITPCSPENNVDCFRLIPKGLKPKQGELLADANYLVYWNPGGPTEETGEGLLMLMKNYWGTTFIPWVMTRCTIIRL